MQILASSNIDFRCQRLHELSRIQSAAAFQHLIGNTPSRYVPRATLMQLFVEKPDHTWTPSDVLERCERAVCHDSINRNYGRRQGSLVTPDDISSVMHYSFDVCMKPLPNPPRPHPHILGNHHPRMDDYDAVCQLYGCGIHERQACHKSKQDGIRGPCFQQEIFD